MIKQADFFRVPGFTERNRAFLVVYLSEFVRDVDDDRSGDKK